MLGKVWDEDGDEDGDGDENGVGHQKGKACLGVEGGGKPTTNLSESLDLVMQGPKTISGLYSNTANKFPFLLNIVSVGFSIPRNPKNLEH